MIPDYIRKDWYNADDEVVYCEVTVFFSDSEQTVSDLIGNRSHSVRIQRLLKKLC